MTPSTSGSPVPTFRFNVPSLCLAFAALTVLVLNQQAAMSPRQAHAATGPTITPLTDEPASAFEGRAANLLGIALLEDAQRRLGDLGDYTATLTTRERMNGVLGESHAIFLKLRSEPFSIYMLWKTGEEEGRELIYVDGANEGNLIVHTMGIRGMLLGTMHVDPNGVLAAAESRHPATQAGLFNLAERLLLGIRSDLDDARISVSMTEVVLNERRAYCFEHVYPTPDVDPNYERVTYYIDQETGLPLCVRNYGWPEREGVSPSEVGEEGLLVEEYTYTDLNFDVALADIDFDPANPEYNYP